VGGLVFLAGAESPGALRGFQEVMHLLFNVSFEAQAAADTVSNAYKEAQDALGEAVDEVERQISLLDNFLEAPENQGTSSQGDPLADGQHGFNSKLEAVSDGDTECTGK